MKGRKKQMHWFQKDENTPKQDMLHGFQDANLEQGFFIQSFFTLTLFVFPLVYSFFGGVAHELTSACHSQVKEEEAHDDEELSKQQKLEVATQTIECIKAGTGPNLPDPIEARRTHGPMDRGPGSRWWVYSWMGVGWKACFFFVPAGWETKGKTLRDRQNQAVGRTVV